MWSSHTLRYVTHNYEKLLCGTYTVVQDISRQSKYLNETDETEYIDQKITFE